MNTVDFQHVRALAAVVQRIVDESGEPAGFDALSWTQRWLNEPVLALGGACPAEFMGTDEGRALVTTLVLQMQSGAYS